MKKFTIVNEPSECKDYFEMAIGYSRIDSRTYRRFCLSKNSSLPTFPSLEYPFIFVTFVSNGKSKMSAKYTTGEY